MRRMVQFIQDLQDRRVFRIASVYVVAMWILIQVASVLFPVFDVSNWVMRLLVIGAVIGFPIVLLLGWFYQLTPEGIVRDAGENIAASKRGIDLVIIAALLVLVVFLLLDDKLLGFANMPSEPAISSRSIAVLPFVNMNELPSTEYFSDGITEELLHTLAQIKGLEVASRTSAFVFKHSDASIPEVAKELRVAYVLEGSVRRDDEQLRITAQLIDGDTDKHLWSRTYDRQFSDIFAVQEDIAAAVAEQLQLTLFATRGHVVPTANMEAYDLYLRGIVAAHGPAASDIERSLVFLGKSLELDPDFTRAREAIARIRQLAAVAD